MTHEDAGKYAAKHPKGTALNKAIAEAIDQKSSDNTLACAVAEKIAKDLNFEIGQVGVSADLMEKKITNCQLGLFGWGDKPSHGKDIPAVDSVPEALEKAIANAAKNREITCATLWRIADQLAVSRKSVSAACDFLNLKIRSCQLGAF